jgi:hypothetical protein
VKTATLSTGLAFLAITWSAAVTEAPINQNPCEVCNLHGRVTVTRVTWDGRPDTTEFAMRECCLTCTPTVVDDAHSKHDPRSRRQIRVELDPSAR